MAQEGIQLSRSTVYRVLNRPLQLRARRHKNLRRGPVPQAKKPREIIQMDTVEFGQVFAFTAIDIHRREAQVVLQPARNARAGQAALQQTMAYFGHCQILQTAGGSEFEAEFAQSVPRYADYHRRARPYRKNEQAFIERFNLTLRRECLGWLDYRPSQIPELQQHVQRWLHYYHFVRPSMAFSPMRPPCPVLNELSHLT